MPSMTSQVDCTSIAMSDIAYRTTHCSVCIYRNSEQTQSCFSFSTWDFKVLFNIKFTCILHYYKTFVKVTTREQVCHIIFPRLVYLKTNVCSMMLLHFKSNQIKFYLSRTHG